MNSADLTVAMLVVSGVGQCAGLIIWGATLSHRVKTIERDMEPLRSLAASVARLEARLEGLMEQLRELSFSIRWARIGNDDHAASD
jgi:hypothetical protein